MPELPEVETIRRALAPHLLGVRIREVRAREVRLRRPVRGDELDDALRGVRITSVERRGKYLLLRTDGRATVVMHLGMSGRLSIVPADAPPVPYECVSFVLDGGRRLCFADMRRFGLVVLWCGRECLPDFLERLGPEPLGKEFTGRYLFERGRCRRCAVHTFLMDQKVVAGIGNIYASEALFCARVDPRRAAATLTLDEWKRVAAGVRRVLRRAIAAGGTTIRDYRTPDGSEGGFHVELSVYGRDGERCVRCGDGGFVERRVLNGRSAYFCASCQR